MRFNLVIQAYAQLKKLYGDDESTIIGNCGNQIYILTIDLNTAERFSKLVGNKTLVNYSRNGKGTSLDKSLTESVDSRSLLDPNELMSLTEGESVVVRVIKRKDKQGNRIKPKPIYNTGKTALKFRYEYLQDEFDTSKSIEDLNIVSGHKYVDLRKLIFGLTEKKELTEQERLLVQEIISKYEDLQEIYIVSSDEKEIYQVLTEFKSYFSNEDKKGLEKILERSF
jgi:type IV secretion system protein VirD4